MELRALRYFQAVYEARSVSAAARACFVSQPSITAAILQLESTLGTRLFVRHARGVLPTEAADRLYPRAKKMGDQAQRILDMFNEGPTPVSLRLGLMRSLGAQRMSGLLKQLHRRIDNLEVTLVDPQEPCDARIVLAETKARHEQFVSIWRDSYQLALPKDWSQAGQASIRLTELDQMPFVNRSPCAVLEQLKLVLKQAGLAIQPRANIRTIEYAWQLVSAGIGAALLPDWPEIRKAEELVLRPIKGVRLQTDIGLAYKDGGADPELLQAVRAVCEQEGGHGD
ncbi:LysR family transcriptional regulator [Gallaecimonas sp. GXIMD4217]|uniref:LysR family transcriptional regulator n=1 Tax=Gallaecimonas sp. GXIMD4217 TaxID=3131927 RepID=UPI00311AEE5C